MKDREAKFSLHWRRDVGGRGGEEGGRGGLGGDPPTRLSGNWVQVLSHHSSHHLSLCDVHPCWNLCRRQSSPRTSSRTPALLSLSGVTSSSSAILALFLTPVAVSPFSPVLKKKGKIIWRRVAHFHGNHVLWYRLGHRGQAQCHLHTNCPAGTLLLWRRHTAPRIHLEVKYNRKKSCW